MIRSIDDGIRTAHCGVLALLLGGLLAANVGSAAALEREGPHDWGIVEAATAASPSASASPSPPKEHVGLTVDTLGIVPASSMQATVGLQGYILQLRAITIAPGGQIAAHSHATRPGLVKVIDGEWVEGRPDGETFYEAGGSDANIEDEHTTHWFFNRGQTPATALVCDIVPAS